MTQAVTTTKIQDQERKRVLATPLALAFVQAVVVRRGITEAQAKQVYLNYFDRAEPRGLPKTG